MDGDRQSEVVWRRARNARARSDQLRQHALAERDQSQALALRLMQTLSEVEGRPLGDHGETFSLRLARMPQALSLVRHELRRWLDLRGVSPLNRPRSRSPAPRPARTRSSIPAVAGPPAFEVEAKCEDGVLLLSVRDFGAWTDASVWRDARPRAEMIRSIMDGVDVTSGQDGTG